jgi:hypothetical protein
MVTFARRKIGVQFALGFFFVTTLRIRHKRKTLVQLITCPVFFFWQNLTNF